MHPDRARIRRVAGEHIYGHGTAVGRAEQAEDDLLLAVPVVAERGQWRTAPLQIAGRDIVEQQGGELGAGLEHAGDYGGEGEVTPAAAGALQEALEAKLTADAEDGGDMAMGQGAAAAEGLLAGAIDLAVAEQGADAVDDLGGQFGEVGEGGAADALAVALGLAEEDGGGDSSPFVKAKRAIKRGSYSQWTWRDLTRGKTRVIPKMALEAPPRFPWRSACCQAPAVRGGAAPSPEPLPQPSKRFARREGSPGSQGESQGRLPTSCQASQKTVPGEGQAADCFTACSGSKSVPLANMAQATASSRAATDRKARAWLWPFSRSASYLARQIRSCCTATLLQ